MSDSSSPDAPSERPGRGRPSREQAAQRHEALLDRALELFLDRGFEMVTLDAIASDLGMTKRTMYARYKDKRALFEASVERAIDRFAVPPGRLDSAEGDSVEATLIAVAQIRMRSAFSPDGLRMNRILNAEGYRFPGLVFLAHERVVRPYTDFVAGYLARNARALALGAEDAGFVAASFFGMLVGPPLRDAAIGAEYDAAMLEDRIRRCVRLLLEGIGPR